VIIVIIVITVIAVILAECWSHSISCAWSYIFSSCYLYRYYSV